MNTSLIGSFSRDQRSQLTQLFTSTPHLRAWAILLFSRHCIATITCLNFWRNFWWRGLQRNKSVIVISLPTKSGKTNEAKMFVAWTISSWILRQFVNGENQPWVQKAVCKPMRQHSVETSDPTKLREAHNDANESLMEKVLRNAGSEIGKLRNELGTFLVHQALSTVL